LMWQLPAAASVTESPEEWPNKMHHWFQYFYPKEWG